MNKTPVSLLQEMMQQSGGKVPSYEFTSSGFNFICICTCVTRNGDTVQSSGSGLTKSAAKHESARQVINLLTGSVKETVDCDTDVKPVGYNAVGELNQKCQVKQVVPNYSLPEYLLKTVGGQQTYVFKIKCSLPGIESCGFGMDKKSAKQKAAHNMLQLFDINNLLYMPNQAVETQGVSLDEEVIKLFSKLTPSRSIRQFTEEKEEGRATEDNPLIESFNTVEELKEAFDNFNVPYTISIFQEKPLILKLAVQDCEFTVLQVKYLHDTYNDVEFNLLKKAYKMFYKVKHKYSPGKSLYF